MTKFLQNNIILIFVCLLMEFEVYDK